MNLVSIIFILLTTFIDIKACLYKKKEIPPVHTIDPGKWNDVNHERFVDRRCECGEHQHNETGDPTWNLFIGHAKMNPTLGEIVVEPVCVGTIITSNLVATVLRCVLTSNETTINVYHAWMPDKYSEELMKKSDIIVSTMSDGEGIRFPVEEIIFKTGAIQHILVGRGKKKDVHNDLLLLRINVTNEFLGLSRLRPICLPGMGSLNFSSKLGTYYGVGEGQHPDNFSTDYHYGIIDSKEFCDDESNIKKRDGENIKEQFQSLCLRWPSTKEMPDSIMNGGSLFIQSVEGGTAFIAGIEYGRKFSSLGGKSFMFVYFTNILPIIKYIEYQANKHESKWCHSPNDLVLPESVTTTNHTGTDFEGPELPPEIGKGSWWCVEHQDILDKKAKTDWTRFEEGENALKDELYQCKENPDTYAISFFQKGKEEPIGQAKFPGRYGRRKDCYEIDKEWVANMDFVSATTCIVILEKCDDDRHREVNEGYYEVHDDDHIRRKGPDNEIRRIQLNAGEKLNLEWFGLARRLTHYRRCLQTDNRDTVTNVEFSTSSEEFVGRYYPRNLCACNNLNSSRGIPAKVINEADCLELYENENCTGWIRTVPAGRSYHSEDLTVSNPNDKNPIKYPQVRSFSRCSVLPNCYNLETTMFRMVLKNKGVNEWKMEFKDYVTIKEQDVVHNAEEERNTHKVERDLTVILGKFKIELMRVASRPNNGPFFELEDENGIGLPKLTIRDVQSFLYNAYENVIHPQASEVKEYIHDFWISRIESKFKEIEMWGSVKCTVKEKISAAENVEFDYYNMIRIHGRMVGGLSLPEDKLKEIIGKDLGYDKVESCDNDGCWVRKDGKFSITVAGGEPDTNVFCVADAVDCKDNPEGSGYIYTGLNYHSSCRG